MDTVTVTLNVRVSFRLATFMYSLWSRVSVRVRVRVKAVSYTHLTLPTIYSV